MTSILTRHTKQIDLNKTLKDICLRYFHGIITISTLFAIYYIHQQIEPLNYIVGLCPIIHIALFAIPYRLEYDSIKPIISVYLIYISIFLYANLLFFWSFGQITAIMWYILIPVAAMIFFNRRSVILWSAYVLVHIISAFIIGPFFADKYSSSLTDQQLLTINIITIIFSLTLLAFFLHNLHKVNAIREMLLREELLNEQKEEKEESVETYKQLYIGILDYFSEKKPYCNPDFTISQLAKELKSNVKYVSTAIKEQENVNFNVFVNRYRIDLVKELIAKDYHNKYTIRHMYFVAGFRHQSTFNKVFKDIEGITPSEYIKVDRVKRL